MKRLRRSRTARLTAQLLTVLLMVPYLVGGLSIRPASAQAQVADVVVMDFNNHSGVGGSLIGKSAAAALALELQQSERWEPVSERAVQDAVNRLNLRPPFDTIALTRIATAVEASSVIIGDVLRVRVAENPAQATVTVAVQVMDRASSEMTNGAVVTASSAPRIGYTGDTSVLIDEAMSKAAFLARQTMERFQLVQGTVLNTSVVGDRYDALINIGARQGVKKAMRFIVLRGNDLVGRGRATSIDADSATLTVTDNYRGVKPEDRVRAVFQLPTLPREVAEADGVRTVSLQQQQGDQQPQPGDVVVPSTTPQGHEKKPGLTSGARLLAGGLILLGLVGLATRGGGTEAGGVAAQATTFGNQPAIDIKWSRPGQIAGPDIIQYQVLRYSAQEGECAVAVVIGDRHEFVDTPSTDTVGRNLSSLVTSGSTSSGGTGTGTGGGTTTSAAACTTPQVTPGRTYIYRIQTVYVPGVSLGGSTSTGGTGGTGGTTTTTTTQALSSPSSASGSVTAIALPALVAPADGATVDLAAVNFQFTSVDGANAYTVQVSADPNFRSGVTDVARVINADQVGAKTLSTGPLNIAAQFGGRTQLFWRVGARNEHDATVPAGGYVFGLPRGLVPAAAAATSRR